MSVYLTSDQHFFHQRALEIMPHRPWKTIDDMNEGLIDNYNSVVKPNDICIFLGDVVMGKKVENVPKIIPRLNGTRYLITGNHDFLPSELRADKLKQMEDLYLFNGFSQIAYGCVKLNMFTDDPTGDKINLCHFPPLASYDPNAEYDRKYDQLKPTIKEGEYLFHGHTHARQHLTAPGIIHVGVDSAICDYSPINLDTLLGLLN